MPNIGTWWRRVRCNDVPTDALMIALAANHEHLRSAAEPVLATRAADAEAALYVWYAEDWHVNGHRCAASEPQLAAFCFVLATMARLIVIFSCPFAAAGWHIPDIGRSVLYCRSPQRLHRILLS